MSSDTQQRARTMASIEVLSFKFGSLLSGEEVSKTLLLNVPTSNLVARAQEIARRWDDDVLCEHGEHRVKTGVLLRALLDHASKDPIPGYAPDVTGERYTAAVIVSARDSDGTVHSNGKVREVALACFEHMLLHVYNAYRTDTGPPPRISTYKDPSDVPSPEDVLYDKILERDGYMCSYHTDEMEYCRARQKFVESGIRHRGVPMKVAHILPFALLGSVSEDAERGQHTHARDQGAQQAAVTTTRTMLRNWASLEVHSLATDPAGINHPRNAMLLCLSEHTLFRLFAFYYLATNREGHYEIWDAVFKDKITEHTFQNLSDEDIALPSANYLATHAAFARVFADSGAGRYFESVFEDSDDIAIFAADGSTNVSGMLRYRFGVPSVSRP